MTKCAAALVLDGSIIDYSAGGKTCYPCTPSIKELFSVMVSINNATISWLFLDFIAPQIKSFK